MAIMQKGAELTTDILKSLLEQHDAQLPRLSRLQDYYEGRHDILSRTMQDSSKPNNKIVNNYPKYITDMLVGYFLGNPVNYSSDDEAYMQKLQDIFDYSDEQDENIELAKLASVKGIAWELLYMDEDAQIRFAEMDPSQIIPVYDDTISQELLYAVRRYGVQQAGDETPSEIVEVYSSASIAKYKYASGELSFIDETPHYFDDVPLVEYRNNKEGLGDFETAMTLIDAYNTAQSDTINDMEYFTDAYLMLRGMGGTTSEDITAMKENRVILVEEGGSAEWLIKSINDTWVENYKTRLKADIHKFSQVPDMSDESFSGNSSGVAIRYKILGMEMLRAAKERKFKRGLQRRIELITNILNKKGGNHDFRSVEIAFSDSLPQNLLELSQTIAQLQPLVSKQTLLTMLPFVEDPAAEYERKAEETESEFGDVYSGIGGDADGAQAADAE